MSAKKRGKGKKALSPRGQALAVAGALLLVAAFGWFVLVSPKRSEAARLEAEVAALDAQILQARLASRKAAAEPVEVADLYLLAKAMPDQTDLAGVLLELNRIAAETGITFTSITPDKSVVVETYQRVPIDVAFEGNFYALSDFLFRLRNLVGVQGGALRATGRLFTIERIAFSEGTDAFPQISATLRINAYVFGTEKPASTPPEPPSTETGEQPAEGEEQPAQPPPADETPEAVGGGSS